MNRIGKSFRDILALCLAVPLVGGVCERGRAQLNTQKDASFVNLNSSVPVTSPSASASTTSVGTSATSLSSLPLGAQAPISAVLGKDDSRYWVHRSANGFREENPRHALVAEFTRQGVEVRSHNQRWGLETRAYGYGDATHRVKAVAPHANANRVEYRRAGVVEWYENGPLGLEQGFNLDHPPGKADGRPLTMELGLRGNLVAALAPGGGGLELRGKGGKAALRYTGLKARDATGRELRSWLEVRGERLLVRVNDGGARYPVVVDPWVQQAELTASDGVANDNFGKSVAMDGSTVVVGAPNKTVGSNSAQGTAYVFVQSGGTWSQQAELTASDGATFDQFGSSVALNGSTVVVGASARTVGSNNAQGAVYVFTQSGTSWSQQAELTASDGANNNYFGFSIALSGSTLVVGATGYPAVGSNVAQGAAYVFVESGGTWSQQAELTASDGAAYDELGYSVALSGSTVVAGAPCHSVNYVCQGATYVFVENGGTWSQQAELTASDGGGNDDFGWSVALSDSTVAVGAPHHMIGSNITQGAAYVFVENGETWSQQAELTSSDGVADDFFGYSVALSGSTVSVGAPQHPYDVVSSAPGPGATYVFVESGGTWSQQAELTASDGAQNDEFGHSVALSGITAVVGAYGHSVGSNPYQGAGYVFESSAPSFTLSASPNSLNVAQGSQGTSTITITPENGFNGSVSFSASGLPSGVTAAFNPNPATSTSALTLTASGTATTGTATVTVTGTSGNLTPTTTLTLTVTSASSGDFTITANPTTVTISSPGQQGTTTATITPNGGFTGNVTLTATITSSPTGAQDTPTLSFGSTSPVDITGASAGTATLTISTTAATSGALANPVPPGVRWYATGSAGLAFALVFGMGIPARRRSWRPRLGLLAFLVALTGGLLACSSGGSSGGGGGGNPGTTAGTYIVTVTGTSGNTMATGTVTLTVQ
jgi:hypothetical protein